ncbi:MAG: UDP-glucose/GDP-mannose dehydrogenase family protein [Chloroflexi bacterium]|nr:UDP-glucose/GDP-mannose dehydrogenase family protein [Chloroflexota bacterium]
MHQPRRIVVVGAGYVGLVTAVGLAEMGHQVEVVEMRPDRLAALRAGRSPIHEAGLQDLLTTSLASGRLTVADHPGVDAEIVMVCVGTPFGADGRSDLGQLDGALRSLAPTLERGAPLVVRSTLPPGATRLVVEWTGLPTERIFSNPEFLRQGTAVHDFLHPTRIVIGHFPDAAPDTIDLVVGLYAELGAPILVVDVSAAELIKNGANAFLALKLSFANEMASLAEEYGTDIEAVLEGISLDPRIGSHYMRPGLGFGGSCLPKELKALAVSGRDRGLGMYVTRAASDANTAQQLRFADRIETEFGPVAGRRIALLGLAFKAGTDDVRDSPALAIARTMLERGARIRAHDPAAAANALRELPELVVVGTPEGALDAAEAAVIATEWPVYGQLDWSDARRRMSGNLVVDGRRLLDREAIVALGFRYIAVGRASGLDIVDARDRSDPAPPRRVRSAATDDGVWLAGKGVAPRV